MGNSTDSSLNSMKAMHSAHLSNIENELNRRYADQASEVVNLRTQNQQLYERLAEFKKNLSDQERAFAASKDELSRKLSKLTDENWAKDLEIEGLQALRTGEESVLMRMKAECSLHLSQLSEATERETELEKLLNEKDAQIAALSEEHARAMREASEAHLHEIESLQETNGILNAQLLRLNEDRSVMENELESATAKLTQAEAKKSELEKTILNLQSEVSANDKSLRESDETIGRLRGALEALKNQQTLEMRELRHEAERGLAAMQMRMNEEFQRQGEEVLAENSRMKQLLGMRESQTEIDRKNLKQWQEQLNYLDQHLRQSKDTLKKDRAEILRLAKQLMQELSAAKQHPFNDYIHIAENEIGKLDVQIKASSALSPVRTKLEERLSQVTEQRDRVRSLLAQTEQQLDERIQAVSAILKV